VAITEGHSGQLIAERKVYQAVAKNPCVKHICELGFNAGHSSALWLLADPDNIVTSFDIFMHDYAPVAQRFLGSRFPGRQALVAGDSLATVPGFVHSLAGQEIRCDIILVDGGHGGDVPYKDIVNFMPLANPTFHILLMDDIHCNGAYCMDPMRCWQRAQDQGLVKELKSWSEENNARGFGVGMYQRVFQRSIGGDAAARGALDSQ